MHRFYLLIASLLAPGAAFADRDVTVTARGLNVRTADGEIVCTVPNGTRLSASGRHGDGERIQVKVQHRGCPAQGFVYSNYVRPVAASGQTASEALVDTAALALRSRPSADDETWKCGLPNRTRLRVTSSRATFADETAWVKVKLSAPVSGCPSEGFVAEAYLKPQDRFEDLPLVQGTAPAPDVADCSGPGCRPGAGSASAQGNLQSVSRDLGRRITEDRGGGNFMAGVKSMIRNRRARPPGLRVNRRGLVQIPLLGNRGPCGSFNYNTSPGDAASRDRVFANPLTACVLTSLMQDWKKNICPNMNSGCRIQFGDISHVTDPAFLGKHKTHTDGYCIDLRPPRTGAHANSPMYRTSPGYDRAMTKKLVDLLKQKGGTNILFNDRSVGTRRARGHDNHIHVCFKDNRTTRSACNNLRVDANVCPELQ